MLSRPMYQTFPYNNGNLPKPEKELYPIISWTGLPKIVYLHDWPMVVGLSTVHTPITQYFERTLAYVMSLIKS